MADKTLKTRIINKHDSDEAWADASSKGFVPKKGEFIIYDSKGILPGRLKIGDGEHTPDDLPPSVVVPMNVIDAQRIKTYEDRNDYYFSSANWDTFIGNNGQYGYNRVYVDRSQNRGQYSMYALNESADVIYNSWYSMHEWDQRFTQEHPGEDFREPYYDEYPKLDSIAQRDENGYLFVPLNPTHKKHAVPLEYVDQLLERLKALEADLYSGTDGLSYELSSNGAYYICTGLGDVPQNERIEIAAYIDGLPVQEIGEQAFKTVKLDSVTIPRTLTKIRAHAFNNATDSIGSLHIKDIAKWANIEFGSWGASPATAEGTKIYINGRYKTELIIPEGLSTIQNRAFAQFRQFTSVTLPESLTYIGQYSFQECTGLSEVEIPANVATVINSCFQNCTNLKSVSFKGTPNKVEAAFSGCTSLATIYVPWGENDVAGAPWGAPDANIHYLKGRAILKAPIILECADSVPTESQTWIRHGGRISMSAEQDSGATSLVITVYGLTDEQLTLRKEWNDSSSTLSLTQRVLDDDRTSITWADKKVFITTDSYSTDGFSDVVESFFNELPWYIDSELSVYGGNTFESLIAAVMNQTIYFSLDNLSYGQYENRTTYTSTLQAYVSTEDIGTITNVQISYPGFKEIYATDSIKLSRQYQLTVSKLATPRDNIGDWLTQQDSIPQDTLPSYILRCIQNDNIAVNVSKISLDKFVITHSIDN